MTCRSAQNPASQSWPRTAPAIPRGPRIGQLDEPHPGGGHAVQQQGDEAGGRAALPFLASDQPCCRRGVRGSPSAAPSREVAKSSDASQMIASSLRTWPSCARPRCPRGAQGSEAAGRTESRILPAPTSALSRSDLAGSRASPVPCRGRGSREWQADRRLPAAGGAAEPDDPAPTMSLARVGAGPADP
jgi:hypothetical protein